MAGQPGVARAFAVRAELCSSFLASRSLNPEMSGSPLRRIAFLWNVLALTKRPFWIEKNAPVEHHCSHYTESVTYHDIRSNESWRITKRVSRKEKNENKKPIKRQSWSSSMTCIYTYPCSGPWEQGMNLLLSCGLLVYVTSCFLNEKESPCCLCPLPIAIRWPVPVGALCRRVLSLPPCFFSCLFRVADSCAVFFFFGWTSCHFLSSAEKERKEFD